MLWFLVAVSGFALLSFRNVVFNEVWIPNGLNSEILQDERAGEPERLQRTAKVPTPRLTWTTENRVRGTDGSLRLTAAPT